MMLTEDEAKTKWCPHARNLHQWNEEAAPNRDADDKPISRCIASACMAWRWREDGGYRQTKDGTWVSGNVTDAIGFCGLAGKP